MPSARGDRSLRDAPPCAIRGFDGFDERARRQVREQGRKLFPTPARDQIAVAKRSAKAGRHTSQHAIADIVAMLVVDALEVIDIEEDDTESCARALGALDLTRQRTLESTTVGQSCERIVARLAHGTMQPARRAQRLSGLECPRAPRLKHRLTR